MNLKTKRRIAYVSIAFLSIYFLFSLFEIFNLTALYKDQIEMSVTLHENVSGDFLWNLLQHAKQITNWINFFQYSALTSAFGIIVINRWIVKIK